MKKILFFIFTFCLLGCEDIYDPNEVFTEPSEFFNYAWVAEYDDFYDGHIEHIISFNRNGTGKELITGWGFSEEYYFDWYWTDNFTTICLEYDRHNTFYLTDVYLSPYTIQCRIEGLVVHFSWYHGW